MDIKRGLVIELPVVIELLCFFSCWRSHHDLINWHKARFISLECFYTLVVYLYWQAEKRGLQIPRGVRDCGIPSGASPSTHSLTGFRMTWNSEVVAVLWNTPSPIQSATKLTSLSYYHSTIPWLNDFPNPSSVSLSIEVLVLRPWGLMNEFDTHGDHSRPTISCHG